MFLDYCMSVCRLQWHGSVFLFVGVLLEMGTILLQILGSYTIFPHMILTYDG